MSGVEEDVRAAGRCGGCFEGEPGKEDTSSRWAGGGDGDGDGGRGAGPIELELELEVDDLEPDNLEPDNLELC